jgi:hypothetical protein
MKPGMIEDLVYEYWEKTSPRTLINIPWYASTMLLSARQLSHVAKTMTHDEVGSHLLEDEAEKLFNYAKKLIIIG